MFQYCTVVHATSFVKPCPMRSAYFSKKISFAQWHYHSLWSPTEAWWLLIENFSQYPARRREIPTAMQCFEGSSESTLIKENARLLWSKCGYFRQIWWVHENIMVPLFYGAHAQSSKLWQYSTILQSHQIEWFHKVQNDNRNQQMYQLDLVLVMRNVIVLCSS